MTALAFHPLVAQNAPILIAARFGRPGAAAMMDAIQKAAKALAQLSDAEWGAGQVRRKATACRTTYDS